MYLKICQTLTLTAKTIHNGIKHILIKQNTFHLYLQKDFYISRNTIETLVFPITMNRDYLNRMVSNQLSQHSY